MDDQDEINTRRQKWKKVAIEILKKDGSMEKGLLLNKCASTNGLQRSSSDYYGVTRLKHLFDVFKDVFEIREEGNKSLISLKSEAELTNPKQLAQKEGSKQDIGKNTKKEKLKQLEKKIVKLLEVHDGDVKLKNLWQFFSQQFHSTPNTKDYGVLNMNDVLHTMDNIVINDGVVKINTPSSYNRLASRPQSSGSQRNDPKGDSLMWGMGAIPKSNATLNSPFPYYIPRVRKDSRDISPTVNPVLQFERQQAPQVRSIDNFNNSAVPPQNPRFTVNYSNSNIIAQNHGKSIGTGLLGAHPYHQPLMQKADPSVYYNSNQSGLGLQTLSNPESIVIDSSPEVKNRIRPSSTCSNTVVQPIVLSSDESDSADCSEDDEACVMPAVPKLERKEICVESINLRGKQLSKLQLETYAQDCIELLADANEYVSPERIERLLLRRLCCQRIHDLGNNIHKIEHLSPVHQHIRLLSKVNAYIQAFVKTRAMYSLYELYENLREFDPEKKSFENLHLGPLQRLPVVYEFFKFPQDVAEIPQITSIDILDYLKEFMTKKNKWTARLEMDEVMNYIVEERQAVNGYYLGIGIKSLPLAAQVLKKAQRDAANSRKSIFDNYTQILKDHIEECFGKFRAVMLSPGATGQNELRSQYLKQPPEKVLRQIFMKFKTLLSVNVPTSKTELRRHKKMDDSISNFLLILDMDPLACVLFHISVCVSDTMLQESAMEMMNPSSPSPSNREDNESGSPDKIAVERPARGKVIGYLKEYIERCLTHGAVTLSNLCRIEEKLNDEFKTTEFSELGFGQFLFFLTTDAAAKSLLSECGGSILGAGSTTGDTDGGFKPTHSDVLVFIRQCSNAGIQQGEDVESALCKQFLVKEVKQLGYGSINTLKTAASKTGRHHTKDDIVTYEGSLSTTNRSVSSGSKKMGALGHQTKDTALMMLHNCPLLTDIGQWVHWPLVFEPELGPLKDFIQKYGGQNTIKIDGDSKILSTDILALETKPGVLLKLSGQSTTEHFCRALEQVKPLLTVGHLISLIVLNKGVDNTPLALLANHIKTTLLKLHSETQIDYIDDEFGIDPAADFVLQCLYVLPKQICLSIADKMFFVPLSEVVGSTKSKTLLLDACKTDSQKYCLEELGCLFGIGEWTKNLLRKAQPCKSEIKTIGSEFAEDIGDTFEVEEISDDESISSNSFLSDEEQIQLTEDQLQPENQESTDQSADLIIFDDLVVIDDEEPEGVKDKSIDEETAGKSDIEIIEEPDIYVDIHQELIEEIRREVFGVGIELDEGGQKLVKILQERQGRSLDRLSKDLYSRDTHFVLELIQNADDNSYDEVVYQSYQGPSVTFIIDKCGITLLNNEHGFKESEIKALCDVGRSTKGKHKYGYIGQKGIGFKSVFRITDRPEIHSNGYHFCFDVHSGPMGYIMPHWIEDENKTLQMWTTRIVLPLKPEMVSQTRSLAARFSDIHPSLLLFLHRLKEITIDNKIDGSELRMHRCDQSNNIVEIKHGDITDRWLVVKKVLDSTKISLQVKSGVDVESTEIALAFPIHNQKNNFQSLPDKQLVFAFLPLRNYGFRFIVQGDFDVPSSRECVDRDSAWNQWIRNEIHTLFIESLEIFKTHPDFSEIEALLTFLQFVPMEDEILDFFKPVATQILGKLRAMECLPVVTNKQGIYQWKMPSQTVIIQDSLVREVVSPEILFQHLNLHYLCNEVAIMLTPSLARNLGVEVMTTEKLLQIGRSLSQMFMTKQIDHNEQVTMIAKWMACIYRSLDELSPDERVYSEIKSMRIIPLSTGELISLLDTIVFIVPPTERPTSVKLKIDAVSEIERDLKTIDSGLVSTPDNEVNSQVQKLLRHIDIKQLSPDDLIHHHIIPVLQSDIWKTKSRDVLISYLIYIKAQYDRQPSIVNLEELKSIVQITTNHGFKSPTTTSIHFTPVYGNKLDLQRQLSGYDWVLIGAEYLMQASGNTLLQWKDFLSKLGVTDFLHVTTEDVPISLDNIENSLWSANRDLLPMSENGYIISDFVCEEFQALVSRNKNPATYNQQMKTLFAQLNQDWDSKYSRFCSTSIKTAEDQILKSVDSSFGMYLKSLKWVPAIVFTECEERNEFRILENETNMKASDLYVRDSEIEAILGHAVNYIDFNMYNQSSFCDFLLVKKTLQVEMVKNLLIDWGKRTDIQKPATFIGSLQQILSVYEYLNANLTHKDAQDLFHDNAVIFVPKFRHQNRRSLIPGRMLKREEVWWHDSSELFSCYHGLLEEYQSELADKHLLSYFYPKEMFEEFFRPVCRVQLSPKMTDFANLLVLIASIHSPTVTNVFSNTLQIYSLIGSSLAPGNSTDETASAIIEVERKSVIQLLSKQKVFCSMKNSWVSLADKPMISDHPEFEKMFSEKEAVHFVKLDYSQKEKRSLSKEVRYNQDNVMLFMKMFPIPKLSDSVKMESQTVNLEPCPKVQLYMHHIVQLIQQYIYSHYDDLYTELKTKNMAEIISTLVFYQTSKIEVIYSLKNMLGVIIPRTEKCICKETEFYFDKAHVDNFPEINKEIASFFSNNDKDVSRYIRGYLMELTQAINNGPNYDEVERILSSQEVYELPNDEVVWSIPAPIIIQPVLPPPIPVEVPEATSDNVEKSLKSWPPRANDSNRKETGNVTFKPLGSKLWPPPAPEGYVLKPRTDFLPSNIKVVASKLEDQEMSSHGPGDRGNASSLKQYQDGEPVMKSNDGQRPNSSESSRELRPNSAGSSQDQRPTAAESTKDHSQILKSDVNEVKDGSVQNSSGQTDSYRGDSRKRKICHTEDSDSKRRASDEIQNVQNSDTNRRMNDSSNSQSYTSPSGSQSTDGQKKMYNMDTPRWQDTSSIIPYEDLGASSETALPLDFPEETHADLSEVGRWGEQVVYDYLLKQKQTNSNIMNVDWVNEEMESGSPYDFVITYRLENGEIQTLYSEVKSTRSNSKRMFEISMQEVKFAMDQSINYEIYRLFNAGESNNVRLVRITNITEKENIRLCMFI